MRAFSDLRRAVKLERRRVSKLAKLDERVARLRRRVSEYEAAGWDEFVRVVDVLVEEGALADPVPASARAPSTPRRRSRFASRWPSSTPSLTPSSTPSATPSATPTRPVLRATGGSATRSRACSTTSRTYLSTAPSAWRIWISTRTKPVRIRRIPSRRRRRRSGSGVRTLARPASGASSPTPSAARARRAALRWRDDEEDADANGDDDRPADVADDSAAYSTAYSTAYSAGGSSNPNPSSLSSPLALTPLGEVCATLRGENELWLGVAATVAGGFDSLARPEECAGLCAALCADATARRSARTARALRWRRRWLGSSPRRRRWRGRSSRRAWTRRWC